MLERLKKAMGIAGKRLVVGALLHINQSDQLRASQNADFWHRTHEANPDLQSLEKWLGWSGRASNLQQEIDGLKAELANLGLGAVVRALLS